MYVWTTHSVNFFSLKCVLHSGEADRVGIQSCASIAALPLHGKMLLDIGRPQSWRRGASNRLLHFVHMYVWPCILWCNYVWRGRPPSSLHCHSSICNLHSLVCWLDHRVCLRALLSAENLWLDRAVSSFHYSSDCGMRKHSTLHMRNYHQHLGNRGNCCVVCVASSRRGRAVWCVEIYFIVRQSVFDSVAMDS